MAPFHGTYQNVPRAIQRTIGIGPLIG